MNTVSRLATVTLAVLGLAVAVPQNAFAQTTYNPATSFSNAQAVSTDGVFRYGYESTLGSAFTLYDKYGFTGPQNVAGDTGSVGSWSAASQGDPPHLTANTSGATYGVFENGATITILPGQLDLHPGPNGQYSILRFTAPTTGLYSFSGIFNDADDRPATTDVHVLIDSIAVANGSIDINGGGDKYTITGSGYPLVSGDTLDFAVGNGGNGYDYDDTGLFATVTAPAAAPEPSQYAAFAVGLMGLGALALKAKRRTA